MNHITVVRCTYESINTAIWLASFNYQVQVVADEQVVADVLDNYKFDHQMSALWQMYIQLGKITLNPSAVDDVVDVWLFLDGLSDDESQEVIQKMVQSSKQKIILSGSQDIGKIFWLSQSVTTNNVCYIPFVFMKDGVGFSSLSSPDLLMIGEKRANVHKNNPLVLLLLSKAKKYHISDIKTVEFARSSIMAMLATRLSLMNEIARLADNACIDIAQVQMILGLDRRIGQEYLSPSWGFGGQTLPIEIDLLDRFFKQNQVGSEILSTVAQINEDQKELLFRKFWRYFDGFIDGKSVMIWGAGYRSGTGRTTNSAIHPLLKLLWSYQIKTQIYAPNAGFELEQMYGNQPLFSLVDDAYRMDGMDALFIINWSDITPPDIARLAAFTLPIFDGKNLLNDAAIATLKNDYEGIGRHSMMLKKAHDE